MVFEWEGELFVTFTLISVKVNVLGVSVCLFEMVVWIDFFCLFGIWFLGKIVGARVVIEVVVEVVVLVWWS